MTYYVYIIENKVSGKLYVGQTRDPERRMRAHMAPSSHSPMHVDVCEHGPAAFSMHVVADCGALDDALSCETMLILALDTRDPALGYNKATNSGPGKRWKGSRGAKMLAPLTPPSTNAPACMSSALRDSLNGIRFKR